MRPSTIVTAVLVIACIAILVGIRVYRNRSRQPEFRTTDEMMQWFATQAIDIAEKDHGIKLDYGVESIKIVDEILGKLHEEQDKRGAVKGTKGLAMAFGAYIGEVIRRSEPASKWERDHPVAGEKSYPIHWLGGESFPIGWCYKRITNGPEDNVWHKYLILKQQRVQQDPEER